MQYNKSEGSKRRILLTFPDIKGVSFKEKHCPIGREVIDNYANVTKKNPALGIRQMAMIGVMTTC